MSIASVFSMKPFQKLWKYTDRGGDDSENIPGVRTNEWDECIIIIKNSLYCSVHFTGFARSFHFIPFTRFTDSLACSVHFIHFTHRASRRFRSFHSPGSVHFIHPVPFISFTSQIQTHIHPLTIIHLLHQLVHDFICHRKRERHLQ